MSQQARNEHPLHSFGYRRPPHWLWRMSPRAFVFVAAVKDIWLIVTGRLTLHRAWQHGYDDHSREKMRAALALAPLRNTRTNPVVDQSKLMGLQQFPPASPELPPHVPNSGFDSRDGGQS